MDMEFCGISKRLTLNSNIHIMPLCANWSTVMVRFMMCGVSP